MDSVTASIFGAIFGAGIAAAVALYNSHRQRRSEMDARVLSAAFEFAALEWRGYVDKALSGRGRSVPPPETFLIRAIEIARLAHSGREITAPELQRISERAQKLTAELFVLQYGVGRADD